MKMLKAVGVIFLGAMISTSATYAAELADNSHRTGSFVVAGLVLIVLSALFRRRKHNL